MEGIIIIIYTLLLKNTIWGEKENDLFGFISAARQNKIMHYRTDIDKLLSLYGELMLRMGVSKLGGYHNNRIEFLQHKNGKPYLNNSNNLHINLSHTKNAILCGFSKKPIGVDVEKIAKPFYDISTKCFHRSELKLLNMFESEEKERIFFVLWTRKEAYVKWSGKGICQNLIEINTIEPAISKNFIAWNDGIYSYCIYCVGDSTIDTITEVTINDIYNFFTLSA